MLERISDSHFACDACHDSRIVYFPHLHEVYYLASTRIPQRLPLGVFTLLEDLDVSPEKFRTDHGNLFARFRRF